MSEQDQFLDVIDRDEAERRFHEAVDLAPVGEEQAPLPEAWGRVLARDVVARLNAPSFDRSNYDGYAVRAAETFGAREEQPRSLRCRPEVIATAMTPDFELRPGEAASIATGGMAPRGADAVIMVEHTDREGDRLSVRRAVTPGHGIAFAGSDIAAGETVLRRGELLTSRETGVLAALGVAQVSVFRRPRVGVISTGDEIIAPDQTMRPGFVFDSNARILADAIRELGGAALELGVARDDSDELRGKLRAALQACDLVLLSGGTSKGAGDLSYRVVRELNDPGIVAHGVALKPGKPICLAATRGKAVVILPGFPTSAIFTFHEFVAPVLRRLAGRFEEQRATLPARMAVKINSEIGRTEYVLVGLVHGGQAASDSLIAFPMGKGSGSVTTFSRADGFVTVGRHEEIVERDAEVRVTMLGRDLQVADLVVIGSHCTGLDYLLGQLQERGFRTKFMAVGSTSGLEAARRGQCDLAGIHLLDPESGVYNRPFVGESLAWLPGYGRLQGLVYRPGDERFADRTADEAVAAAGHDAGCLMVNRNQGSGTRILIDQLLAGSRPNGYAFQARSHNAVAAAVLQGRADWGLAIKTVADQAGLGFLPLTEEQYDFVVPRSRLQRRAVLAFRQLLEDAAIRDHLRGCGLAPP